MTDPRIGTQVLDSIEDDLKTLREHLRVIAADNQKLRELLTRWVQTFPLSFNPPKAVYRLTIDTLEELK